MKQINKGKEPASLLNYRQQPLATYEDYREKDDLRQSLLEEQGYICCYCMQRLHKEDMKIEHWKPQSKHPELQLDYQNLLGACKGNEGSPAYLQHCDTSKGEQELTISPTNKWKNCEHLVKYRNNGVVYSDDPFIEHELNQVLNLNLETLARNREEVIDQIREDITRIKGKRASWSIQDVKRKIEEYESKTAGRYYPYCQAVVYFLKKRFKKELGLS